MLSVLRRQNFQVAFTIPISTVHLRASILPRTASQHVTGSLFKDIKNMEKVND